MNAQVAVGGFQQRLQLVERERVIHGQCADNSEPHAFVDETVQPSRNAFLRSARPAPSRLADLAFGLFFVRQCFRLAHNSS